VVVVGVSQHPGKFGSAALHNVVRGGFAGPVFAVGRSGGELCGLPILPSVDDVPVRAASFAMVCVPAAHVVGALRECAARGVRAAYVAGGGFAEEGGDGIERQAELVRTADELGVVLLGPNGQGLVSTPSLLCAQIVAPMPAAGPIGLVSQSGNIASALQNVATGSGLGISRAVSIGNAAAIDLVDVLEALADDPATRVAVAYCEALPAVPALVERLAAVSAVLPVVLLAGATTQAGSGAAMAHTGTAASDHRVVAGICARAGVVLVRDLEEAFDAAATLATQPLPAGRRVAVVTTAGGWGVLAADRLAEEGLELAPLSPALVADLDELLPNRWSRHNPIDLAGGERRGAVAAVIARVAADPDVDAVLHLGLGIQANSADLIASGPFADEPDLARIVAYHRRSDVELAEAAAAASGPDGVPVLSATELAVAAPANAGVAALRAAGRYCYPTAHRAIRALAHAERHARWRRREGL
jgi:acyl-CoA synthetase (NDP forming)